MRGVDEKVLGEMKRGERTCGDPMCPDPYCWMEEEGIEEERGVDDASPIV